MTPQRPEVSQMQLSADAIAHMLRGVLMTHQPEERRELLVQTINWLRARVAEFDEAARRKRPAVIADPAAEPAPFGKGTRSSDLAA